MPVFAAIDVGSNSCRLKIARVVAHRLKTLHEDREVTRLGASVFESGLVSPEAMAATLRSLKRFQRAVQTHAADRVRVVATSAMRDARNGEAFQAWVKAETGWTLEVISGLEEGRLIHHGVMAGEPAATGRVLLIDLGGGSCEITLSDHKRIKETVSLPLGAVRLTQQFLSEDPPTPEGLGQMRQLIARELRRARRRVHAEDINHVIATSGTAAALSDACAALANSAKPARKAVGKQGRGMAQAIARAGVAAGIAPTALVRKLAARMEKMQLPEREAIPGIGPRRAEIIIAGSHVFSEMLESFSLPGFRYSPLGLRDGLLAQMLAEFDTRASGHKEFEKERWESVLSTARRYGVEVRSNDPVREHALQLFREMRALHELPAEYENLLGAAAVLRDTGKYINHQGHHRHTQYIISSSEMYGYTPVQRTIISAIARYLGKSRPQPSDRALRNIPTEEHKSVTRAVVLLRLAVALNQDRASDVLRVTARVYPKRIYIDIKPGRTGAELELWSLRKEADYFREVFGRELFPALS
ncbi:Ppx/GppA phosphatase family protein [Occallatibacter riparius]|uniref:Ppx/GppA family phosphatase n=1 Tax=Occallatibacter riparius TaxID=1002689 RepID=A0A9J7BVZ0_9BACT|nr:Ppx/GppA phosphatase family protein [Occallatibacter riparius]UWZ86689.1 Ppx/GppA family phosphatase [Occallatibacter riparius]